MESNTETQPPENANENILKPKVKRTLTDEQRRVLAERMRAINDKRIADVMAKKQLAAAAEPAKPKAKPKVEIPNPPVFEPPKAAETPKVKPKKRVIKVVELTDDDDDDSSESEEEIIIVPKAKAPKAKAPKAKAPKRKPDPESEEETAPIVKPKAKPRAKPEPPAPEPPKILYKFL